MDTFGLGLTHLEQEGDNEPPEICSCNGSREIKVWFGGTVIHVVPCPNCTSEE